MSLTSFLSQVQSNCSQMGLFPRDGRVLVAVSGGPDSVALLHALHRLAPEWGVSLGVAHLNHLTRGAESDQDATFVKTLADQLGLTCVIDSRALTKDAGSFQDAARQVRRGFFDDVARDHNFDFIATGHTADDQAETVLMNLFRGSGLRGLAGMLPRRGRWVRPLLGCTRRQVLEFLTGLDAEFRTDATNLETTYLRNRMRLELIPDLETRYAPHLRDHLSQMARLLQQDEAFLSQCAETELETLRKAGTPPHSLPIEYLTGQPPALQSRIIREVIRILKGDLKRVEARHIQQILNLICEGRAEGAVLPGHIQVSRRAGSLHFEKTQRRTPGILKNEASPKPVRLEIPGDTVVAAGGLMFHAEVLAPAERDVRSAQINQAFLDYDLVQAGVWARFFKEGDRFSPLGTEGSKKLKSFFIDEKVPRDQRRQIPLLTDADGDIIWVYGQRISHRFRVTSTTRNVLFLEGLV